MVKAVFSNGEELSAKDLADLKRIGLEIGSENAHYKLVYKDSEKYWFTVAKTSSDKKRSGKNLISDINNALSVYK